MKTERSDSNARGSNSVAALVRWLRCGMCMLRATAFLAMALATALAGGCGPAGLRIDVCKATLEAFEVCGTTHVLYSKVDEVPGDQGLADLADAMNLPARWIADGQDIPDDLGLAEGRIIASLGLLPSHRQPGVLALG